MDAKQKYITQQAAAVIMRSVRLQGVTSMQLMGIWNSLKVKPHHSKGPSKLGKVYRCTNKYGGRQVSHNKENARRRRQIEAGTLKLA